MNEIYVSPVSYKISDLLGEGLNSCVYRAVKQNENYGVSFEVALKILKSEKLVELWRNEFSRLSSIKSAHCVSLLGWELVYGKPALVLEYVNGVTLAELVEQETLTGNDLQNIYFQAEQGLIDLRDSGLYHGDLNLHNIMVNTDGVVKLVDFGVYSQKDRIMTTVRFASPEVLAGEPPCFTSDMFSLKTIVYHLASQNQILNFQISAETQKNAVCARLGAKVKSALAVKNRKIGKTQTLSRIKMKEWTTLGLLRTFFCILLVGSTMLSYGDQKMPKQFAKAVLEIRTKEWVKIRVDGKNYGYAPVNIHLEPGRPHTINWQTAKTQSQTSLTLKEAQHIVLDDGFFADP